MRQPAGTGAHSRPSKTWRCRGARCGQVARSAEQPPRSAWCTLPAFHLLVEPAEIREKSEREVEQLRRDPDEIHRDDRRHDESAGERRRQRRVHPRMEEQVPAPGDEREKNRVEHEKSIRAEESHEGRRKQRIRECLAVEESLLVGIRYGAGPDERRTPHQPGVDDIPPAFQEESGRAGGEFSPHPYQVLTTVREVAVLGEAVPHHVVRAPHRSGSPSRRAGSRR